MNSLCSLRKLPLMLRNTRIHVKTAIFCMHVTDGLNTSARLYVLQCMLGKNVDDFVESSRLSSIIVKYILLNHADFKQNKRSKFTRCFFMLSNCERELSTTAT